MTFDDIRAAHPQLGMALYAIEAGGPITFEVHTPDDQVFSWIGPTEAAVLAQAFPPDEFDRVVVTVEDGVNDEPTPDIFS